MAVCRSDDSTGDDNDDLFAPDGEEGLTSKGGTGGSSGGGAAKVVEPVWKKRKYNRVHSLIDQQMNKRGQSAGVATRNNVQNQVMHIAYLNTWIFRHYS